ncbi:MAG: hypothetical protein UW35_C0037G0005 [Candidatus Collierbacteria bacterium GW2011_GWF2_44_15]|uniref:Uncharacterized protein n=2 Tax=Candidatus Collieribacteriota TaxID=1752725 RepID=A0A0G1HDE7_9BACT|nr:MAG: hypothetical protein UW26_C0027G0005 [Candidatus Collierbacteria bacterium GW2011_GWF1_44_12]KKT45416.1 MAG: hypothetical protein UW35_C0037G0005 [Candidatus Collierbacteria bacterium GW2011_GWF2_44_15]
MTESKLSPSESLTSEAISWSQRWGEQPPAEVSREMRRIEDKASRILDGSNEKLTFAEVFYLNNKDAEIF